ncbi:hypothetical protein D3C73_1019760 [compost metagenome]
MLGEQVADLARGRFKHHIHRRPGRIGGLQAIGRPGSHAGVRRQDLAPGAILLVEFVGATRLGAVFKAGLAHDGFKHFGVAAVHDAQHVAKALQVAGVLVLPCRGGLALALGQLAAVIPLQGSIGCGFAGHAVHVLVARRVHGGFHDLQRGVDIHRVFFRAGRRQFQFADQGMAEFVHENALHQADVHRDDTLGVAAKTGVRTRALQAGIIAALRGCRLRRRRGRLRVLRFGAPAATTRRQSGPWRQASSRRRICRGLRSALVGGDGKVRNAERANVIGHDADVAAQRGHIGNVADLLAVHDEARGAGHFNHFDAV